MPNEKKKKESIVTQYTKGVKVSGWIFAVLAIASIVVYFVDSDNNFFLILAFIMVVVWRLMKTFDKEEAQNIRQNPTIVNDIEENENENKEQE